MSQYSESQRGAVEPPTIGGTNGDHLEQPTVDTETTFNTIDCWIYEGIANNNPINKTVSSSEIDAWLQTPVPSKNGQQPMAGLRLIIGSQTANQKLLFTKTHLQGLVKDASLQSLIYEIMRGSVGVTARLCLEGSDPGKILTDSL
jgi:hypothetical protein